MLECISLQCNIHDEVVERGFDPRTSEPIIITNFDLSTWAVHRQIFSKYTTIPHRIKSTLLAALGFILLYSTYVSADTPHIVPYCTQNRLFLGR